MFSRLLVFSLIIGFTVGVVVRTPITRKESLDAKLVREKRYHELRVLNRVRMARLSNPFVSRFDVARQPLYDYADQEFNIRISLGSPAQVIEVIPETASATSWVVDKTCNGSASYNDCPNYCYTNKQWCALFCEDYCCGTSSPLQSPHPVTYGDPCANKTLFDSSASSTYQSTGKDFHIAGGLGNVSGIVGKDTLTLGDPKSGSTIQLPDTTFGQADRLSVAYSTFKFNGVLGLGFPATSSPNTVPVLQHAIDQGLLDEPVFSIWLQKGGVQAEDKVDGALTLGGRDTDHCSSDVTFIPLISKVIWWFNIAGIATNDKKTDGQFVTIASLPTPFNLITPAMMSDLTAESNADYDYDLGVYQVDCDVKFNWTVFVDSQTKLELKASDLIFQYPNGNCYLSFTSLDSSVGGIDVVLGIPVLQAYCQTYDYTNGQLGFSKAL